MRVVQIQKLIPSAFTLGNIALGFMGIIASAAGEFRLACIYLFLGALCDMADGRLARWLNATSKFGKELDSLSDMVSFGVAPAVMIYFAALKSLGPIGLLPALTYMLCGAVRLARYNIDTQEISKHSFSGVPIPIAASYIWSLVMVHDSLPMPIIVSLTLLMSGLMISTVKTPNFRKDGLPVWMMLFGLALFVVFLFRPGALMWSLWTGWNFVLIGANYASLRRRGI